MRLADNPSISELNDNNPAVIMMVSQRNDDMRLEGDSATDRAKEPELCTNSHNDNNDDLALGPT